MKFWLNFWKLNTQDYSIRSINELFSIRIFQNTVFSTPKSTFDVNKVPPPNRPQFQCVQSVQCLVACGLCSVMLQNSFWCRHYFQLNLNCHFNNSTNALNHLNSAAVTAGQWTHYDGRGHSSCHQGMPAAGAILLS